MNLYCPCCRIVAAIDLHLDDGDTMTCRECSEEFTTEDVRKLIDAADAWRAILAWVERCPAREPAAA